MTAENSKSKTKDIIFRLEEHLFGFEISRVREVMSTKSVEIEYVPDINKYFRGIIKGSSGIQVPVIDLFLLLNKENRDLKFKKDSCIVIFDGGGCHLGIYMDSAVSVVQIDMSKDRVLETSNVSHVYSFISDIVKIKQKGEIISIKQIDYEKLLIALEMRNGI